MNNSVHIRFTEPSGTQTFKIEKPVSDSIYNELLKQNLTLTKEIFKIDNLKIFGRHQTGVKYFDLNNPIDCDYAFNFDLLFLVRIDNNTNIQYNVTNEKQKLNDSNVTYKRSSELLMKDNSKDTIMLCAGASLKIHKNAIKNGTLINVSAISMKNDGLGGSNITSLDLSRSEQNETYNANQKN